MDQRKEIAREIARRYVNLSKECLEQFAEILTPLKFKRGTKIVAEGEVCENLYYIEKGLTRQYYTKNGKEVTEVSHDSLFLGGKEIEIPNTTQADIDKVLKILESVDSSSVVDENITKIVTEETGAFFEGQKSALETAQIIQNRVKVYIAETK